MQDSLIHCMLWEPVREYQYVPVPREKLRNGLEIPLLGLGTWKAEVCSMSFAENAACARWNPPRHAIPSLFILL